ncbi:unnamed protein product [Prorocentrum cordatum]|uniref:cellulase n=1 Tax=Prorocentrum cordatum TaxID=2364126 RepID=A0ABN9Q5I3_9DINO|nr:unnamed protein product [Polarella glacialis]
MAGGMAQALTFAAALVAARAQMKGDVSPKEDHPKLSMEECTSDGTCTSTDYSVVLDMSWRWMHNVGGYTNCINEADNMWADDYCPDAATCAKKCAVEGLNSTQYSDTYGISASKDASSLTLKYVPGSRVYMLDGTGKEYLMFQLKNKEFTFDIDLSTLPCGTNAALYLIEMARGVGASVAARCEALARMAKGMLAVGEEGDAAAEDERRRWSASSLEARYEALTTMARSMQAVAEGGDAAAEDAAAEAAAGSSEAAEAEGPEAAAARLLAAGCERLVRTLALAAGQLGDRSSDLWLLAQGFHALGHRRRCELVAEAVRGLGALPAQDGAQTSWWPLRRACGARGGAGGTWPTPPSSSPPARQAPSIAAPAPCPRWWAARGARRRSPRSWSCWTRWRRRCGGCPRTSARSCTAGWTTRSRSGFHPRCWRRPSPGCRRRRGGRHRGVARGGRRPPRRGRALALRRPGAGLRHPRLHRGGRRGGAAERGLLRGGRGRAVGGPLRRAAEAERGRLLAQLAARPGAVPVAVAPQRARAGEEGLGARGARGRRSYASPPRAAPPRSRRARRPRGASSPRRRRAGPRGSAATARPRRSC